MFDYVRFPEDDVPLYFPGHKLRIAAFDYLPIIEYRKTIVDHYYEILEKYQDNLEEEEKVMEMRLEEVLRRSGIS